MSARMQQLALVTRDAHSALRDLKTLVDLATEKMHAAELETVGVAISQSRADVPSRTLLTAAEALQSPKFEAAVRQARAKLEAALAWHLPQEKAARSQ
jgi:hypothetical protein